MRTFEIGRWRFEPAARTLTDGLTSRSLTPKAADVMLALVEADGQVVSRADLLDLVWPDTDIGEEVLTHSVAELRRALGDGRAREIIQTVYGAGYRLRQRAKPVGSRAPADSFENTRGYDLSAYLAVAEARILCERHGENALGEAVELCREAAARATHFVPALSEYAALSAMRYLYQGDDGEDLFAALRLADSAVAQCPELASSHMSRGVVLTALRREPEARAAFDRAIVCDSRDFHAHYQYARSLFAFGAREDAARIAECASSLKLDDYRPLILAASTWLSLGRSDRASAAASAGLGRVRLRLSMGADDERVGCAQSLLLALKGECEEAYGTMKCCEERSDAELYYGVAAYAAIGETQTALDRLERLVEHGFRHRDWLQSDPALNRLHETRKFKRLLRALTVS